MNRPRGAALWAITAAGYVAVGLAGWTTCSVRWGLGAAAIIGLPLGVLWGTRGAAASPGADASGRTPETARTTPDTSGQHAPDQPGKHPDDPRTRLATALKCAPDTWPNLIEMAAATERDATRAETRAETLRGQLAQAQQRAEQAEDTITQARAALSELETCDTPDCALSHHVQALHDALGEPAPAAHCEVVQLPDGPALITGDAPLDDIGRQHLATIIAAARRRYAAEHLDQGDTP